MGLFDKKEKETRDKENVLYNLPTSFISPPRNPLFPKLEKLIRQAEEHHSAGDKELCYEILGLIWRTVDKSKEKQVLLDDFFKDIQSDVYKIQNDSDIPETPTRDTNDTNVNV